MQPESFTTLLQVFVKVLLAPKCFQDRQCNSHTIVSLLLILTSIDERHQSAIIQDVMGSLQKYAAQPY